MARTTARPKASKEKTLRTRRTRCPTCHKTMWSAYVSHRTVSTLEGVHQIHLHVRRCRSPSCSRYHGAAFGRNHTASRRLQPARCYEHPEAYRILGIRAG